MPLVSINIPCYNRKDLLKECVQSFINQTFTDFEIVIVDDGSEEDISFVKDMDNRVKYIRQEHLGIARAFNLALDNSNGVYIMPFGSDDIAMPDLLEETVALMEKYKNKFDVIYTNYWIKRKDGTLQRKLSTKTLKPEDAYAEMLKKQYIPHPASLWKREVFPRYDESLESAVDLELFLTAMENGVRFKHRKCKLWIYRTGHAREFGTQRQIDCCQIILAKRGYYFDTKTRRGIKIK